MNETNGNNTVERAVEYLTYILKPMCDYPQDIKIVYTIDVRGLLLDMTANDKDLSRIIGKHGINIWSLRNIMRVWGQMNSDAVVKLLCRGRGEEFYSRRHKQEESTSQ